MDKNQLRSLPAAVAGPGKALPSQRGDGDHSCSALQLCPLLLGAASPALYTLHWGKQGFARAGWKRWEAAPKAAVGNIPWLVPISHKHNSTTEQWAPHCEGRSPLIWGQFSTGLEMNSFWALWLFLKYLKTTYCQIMVRSSCSCRKKKGERKGSTATSQATPALIAVWSLINAEGMTATISANCWAEGAV